jgi:hypothetical protein
MGLYNQIPLWNPECESLYAAFSPYLTNFVGVGLMRRKIDASESNKYPANANHSTLLHSESKYEHLCKVLISILVDYESRHPAAADEHQK